MTKRFSWRHILSTVLMLLFLIITIGALPLPLLDHLENQAYDMRIQLTMPGDVDDRVVILDLDEKSLAEVGRWPWSRNVLANMVDTLFKHYEVGALGFDVVFAEPDASSGAQVLEELAAGPLKENTPFLEAFDKLRPQLDRDRMFSKSLENRPVVMGYYFKTHVEKGSATSGELPSPLIEMKELSEAPLALVNARGFGANLPILQQQAMTGGFFDNPLLDEDGVFRRVPLLQQYDGKVYQSLAFGLARAILGRPPISVHYAPDNVANGINWGLEWVGLGNYRIPVDQSGAVLVPYRGKQGSYPYVSAVDVLNRKVDKDLLMGRAVLVGTTAPGLLDLRTTPVQKSYAGVEIHANIISGILDGSIKHQPGYTIGIELVTVLLLAGLMTFLYPRLSPLWTTVFTALLLILVVLVNLILWTHVKLAVPLAPPLVFILSMFMLHMSYGFFVEARGKRQIAKMFGQYVPNELVDEMNQSGQDFTIGGESREMTVLFSDVRGFTTISEGLKPDELVNLMNAFLTPMTGVIHHHRGTIDKYMGDAIMAFWGAPLADPDHARHALLAALDMVKGMADLKEEFHARGWPTLKIGVGLNTGVMNVGNMGSEFRMAYTVLGDAVNLGSRLEGLSKPYGVGIVVSEFTKAKVNDMLFRELDRVRVKGKDEPVAIFEPIGIESEVDPQIQALVGAYHQAVTLYRGQKWQEAEKRFTALKAKEPERATLHQLYLDRIAHFKTEPPGPDWDGVFTFTTK